MNKWPIVGVFLLCLLLPQPAVPSRPVVITPDFARDNHQAKAWVNWSDYVILAAGKGEIRAVRGFHYAPYHALAKARQQAYRRLLKTGKSVQLTPAQTVGEALQSEEKLLAGFENLLKKAEVVQTDFFSTGAVEVLLQAPLTGGVASLVLPDEVTRLEEIESGRESLQTEASPHTGLVVDARGLTIEPAMCFKLVDENGKEVYGPAYASRENVVAAGMCRYVSDIADIEEMERIGENPMVVKGIRVHPPGASDIVISDTDASRLRGSVEHLTFLKHCRVVVVMDAQVPKN